jgi:branched-chain amino acid transport system substrate-binding protein
MNNKNFEEFNQITMPQAWKDEIFAAVSKQKAKTPAKALTLLPWGKITAYAAALALVASTIAFFANRNIPGNALSSSMSSIEETVSPTTTSTTASRPLWPGNGNGNSRGVTDYEIKVGNIADTGFYDSVSQPYLAGVRAAFAEYNKTAIRKINFTTYSDNFNSSESLYYAKKLVEDDKVFAIAGQLGSPTYLGTEQYLKDSGVLNIAPVANLKNLYSNNAFNANTGKYIFPVQPIDYVEGQVLAARAIGAGAKKIGIVYQNTEQGLDILDGAKLRINSAGGIIVEAEVDVSASNVAAAVALLKNANIGAVIVACGFATTPDVIDALIDAGIRVDVYCGYNCLNVAAVYIQNCKYTSASGFNIYSNGFLDITGHAEDYSDFLAAIDSSEHATNVFAVAGYGYAKAFLAGIERMEAAGADINEENYVYAMESAPVYVPFYGYLDYSGGKRAGPEKFALMKYDATTQSLLEVEVNGQKKELTN